SCCAVATASWVLALFSASSACCVAGFSASLFASSRSRPTVFSASVTRLVAVLWFFSAVQYSAPACAKQCSLVRIAVVRRRWSIPPSAPVVVSQPWPPSLRAHRAAVLPPRARRACPPPHPPASSAHHGGTSLDRAPGARS